jgi:hypothetical protein
MTEFLHVNMHTFYVAMIVTFGLVLGLMVVSSLHAGFLYDSRVSSTVRITAARLALSERGKHE